MPNYEMKYGVSDVARLLSVGKDLVTTWAHQFSDYLKSPANPPKETPRQFSIDDVRVLAYVYMYWEDDPDIESIKIGLNLEEHFEEPIRDFISSITPLFMDPPEDILADSYKRAGDMIVDAVLAKDETNELCYPVIYNYRHATELYLKSIVRQRKKKQDHDLDWLLQEFKKQLKIELNATLPEHLENIILAFHDFDPNGTTFRYGESLQSDEVIVDIAHMKDSMGRLTEAFHKVRNHRSGIMVSPQKNRIKHETV
jgi:hypothetical protein